MHPETTERKDMSVARLLTISVAARIVVDTSVQIFSPFLPIIANGLGTNVVVMGRLVGLRSAMGLLSPLFGAAADRGSYRRVLQIGLLSCAAGMAIIGFSPNVWVAIPGMILSGLGFAAFVPTLQAYVSARLPYGRRARGLGILEYSWAVTGIVGLYTVGQLIEAGGWRAPFFLLAAGLLIAAVVFGMLPAAHRNIVTTSASTGQQPQASAVRRLVQFFDLGENARSAYAAIIVNSFLMFASVQIMIIYGAWLNSEYNLSAAQLGTVALVFGLFDLAASVSVSLFTDAVGKRRSVLLGSIGTLAGYLFMPFFNVAAVPAVLAIGITRGLFEFSVVANIPLLSEQVPDRRGKVMTLSAAVSLLAVTMANFAAPWLYTEYGVPAVTTLSALATAICLAVLVVFVREPESQAGG